MAGRFSQQFLDDLLTRIDIVELIDARVPLKRSGNSYKACCPFHSEKTPSFNVNRGKQFFHCFGCGAHGNAIDFLRTYERLDFPEAVANLAESAGVPLPDAENSGHWQEEQRLSRTLCDLQERVARFYRHQLRRHPDAAQAINYLKQRGIDGDIARRYGIGYAPPGWNNFPDEFDPADLIAAGLQISKPPSCYDRFRNRIMFPIRDRRGRVVGFGGRVLDDAQPKYLNSPETTVFKKHEQVYGLFEALGTDSACERLIVVEGYMDVIALAQCGFPHTVATLGTATSPEHIELLFRFTEEIVFCFDGDAAGHKAAWKALQAVLPVLPEGRVVRFLSLPQGEDPDSLVRKEGTQAFQERLAGSSLLSDYLFEQLARNLSLESIEGRTALIKRANPLLQTMKPGPFRQMMRARLADLTRGPEAPPPAPGRPPRPRPDATLLRPSARNRLLTLLIHHPGLAERIDAATRARLETDASSGPLFARLLEFLQHETEVSAEQIREHFGGTADASLFQQLSAIECPIGGEALETELRDTLSRISGQADEARLDQLIRRAREGLLNNDERAQMRQLMGKTRKND